MLEYTDYIRISVSGKDEKERLPGQCSEIFRPSAKCIATGVNAKEEYELAAALNMEYMEGNYIAETLMTKANKIDYLQEISSSWSEPYPRMSRTWMSWKKSSAEMRD